MINPSVKVAVVVVNWNSGHFLGRCLASLAKQDLTPQKILVMDNASSDDSLAGLDKRFPNVNWIRLENNIGFAAANNLAVHEAVDCEWICFLNPDAFPEPDWLANLVRGAELNTDYSFFGSHMRRHGGEGELDGTGDTYHVSGLAWRRDHGAPSSQAVRQDGEIFAPCAAAALIKKDAFLQAGGFDENFFCYFEDVDLAFRLRLLGHRCFYVADAIVEHVGSASTHRWSDFALYHGHRNMVWAYFKNMPGWLVWLFLPQHLLVNAATLIWFTLRGRPRVIFKAKWDAWKDLPRVLAQRKKIQQELNIPARAIKNVMARGWVLPFLSSRKRSV